MIDIHSQSSCLRSIAPIIRGIHTPLLVTAGPRFVPSQPAITAGVVAADTRTHTTTTVAQVRNFSERRRR